MFSRRDVLLGLAATGAVATERRVAAVPNTDVPAPAPINWALAVWVDELTLVKA